MKNKRKQNSFLLLTFIFRIEIFQWVTAVSNKKIPRRGLNIKRFKPAFIVPLHRRLTRARRFQSAAKRRYSIDFSLVKEIVHFSDSELSRDLIFSFRVPCPRTPRRKSGPRSPDRQGLSKGKCRQRARVSPQNSARPPPDKSKSRGAPTSDKEPHHNKHCGFQCRHQGKREQLLRLSAPQAGCARYGCRFATRRADFHVPHGSVLSWRACS
jgi:hypothetical protein